MINIPSSNGTLRYVTNAIGIINTSKTSKLSNIIIDIDENIKTNSEYEIIIKGYDKYYNPVSIDYSKLKIETTGISSKISSNTLITEDEIGDLTIKVKYGKIETAKTITVEQKDYFLDLEESLTNSSGEKQIIFINSFIKENTLLANLINQKILCESQSSNLLVLDEILPNTIKEFENYSILSMDVRNCGLRDTNYNQYLSIENDIKNTINNNILIILKGSLYDFADEDEKKALLNILDNIQKEYSKNIMIVQASENNSFELLNNIKILNVTKTIDYKDFSNIRYIYTNISNNVYDIGLQKLYKMAEK